VYDGREVTVSDEVVEHIVRKHPEMLALLRLSKARLPDGGGYTIRGLRDRKLSALGRAPDNVRTSADAFGGSTQTWRGLDVTMDARLDRLLLQGGVSTGGRHSTTASCRGGCRRGSAPASSAARRRST